MGRLYANIQPSKTSSTFSQSNSRNSLSMDVPDVNIQMEDEEELVTIGSPDSADMREAETLKAFRYLAPQVSYT